MSEFLFKNSQRVSVPTKYSGADGVQAVITRCSSFVGREPEYRLEWQANDVVAETGHLVPCFAAVSESDLVAAQPAEAFSREEMERRIHQAVHINNQKWIKANLAERRKRNRKRR